jgi:hypothetical protein
MTNEGLIENFVNRIKVGEISFDQVRTELEAKGLDEQIIKVIVRHVDNEVQHGLISSSKRRTVDQYIFVGISATAIGFVLTVGSFAGLFTYGNSYLIVVAYGPLFGGLALLFVGLRSKKRRHKGGAGHSTKQFLRKGGSRPNTFGDSL